MGNNREVVFVAAENGALPGAKVGGVADVVRDLPIALCSQSVRVQVLTPSYGVLHKLEQARPDGTLVVNFAGEQTDVEIWRIDDAEHDITHVIFDHERFSRDGVGVVYSDDEPDRPFYRDAAKFAFFSRVVACWLLRRDAPPDVVHLHDWHAALVLALREYDNAFAGLKNLRMVFTIHNLSYQGIRPLRDDESSFAAWYPGVDFDDRIVDPRYRNCVNPMLAGIRLADGLSTVSPSYAEEICRPSNPDAGFIGGEGLEDALRQAFVERRLAGILNGCFYDEEPARRNWRQLLSLLRRQVDDWQEKDPDNEAHALAKARIAQLHRRPPMLMVSVGRLVAQKATLFLSDTGQTIAALEQLAVDTGDSGVIVILGSGEAHIEAGILSIAQRHSNIILLLGYAEQLSKQLYDNGDVFLMPSSFEPCGISQMLAMRAGVPCVVHGVGGLKDTVEEGNSGFVFNGPDLQQQAAAFVAATGRARAMFSAQPGDWRAMKRRAAAQRFEWSRAATETDDQLYGVSTHAR